MTNWKLPKRKPRRGDCYRNAADFHRVNPDWTLVHGVAVGTGPTNMGEKIGHAWCEKDGFVYDAFRANFMPAFLYYQAGQISFTVAYTRAEAKALQRDNGHYGPWDETVAAAAHNEVAS